MNTNATAADTALPVPRIFVSATTGDLGSVRRAVANGLRGIGALAVEQEYFAPPGQTIIAMLEEKIKGCQAVIHIAGHRYGSEDENAKPSMRGHTYTEGRRSYTQLEHDLALKHGKRLYVFICADTFPYDPTAPEPVEKQSLQTDHRYRLLSSSHFRNVITNNDELTEKVNKLDEQVHIIAGELTQVSEKVDTLSGSMRRYVLIATIVATLIGGGVWLGVQKLGQMDKTIASLNSRLIGISPTTDAITTQVQVEDRNENSSAPVLDARAAIISKLGLTDEQLTARLQSEQNALTDLLTALEQLHPVTLSEISEVRHIRRTVIDKLGDAEIAAVHYEKAIEHYRTASALYDPIAEPAEWTQAHSSLISSLARAGKYDEGLRIAQTTLEACERLLGADHYRTLDCVMHLAHLSILNGDNKNAETYLLRALDGRERTLGRDHTDTLDTLDSIVGFYSNCGTPVKAEPFALRAMDICERTLGKDDPKTLECVAALALMYHWKGDYTKAEPMYLRVLDYRERTLGKEHPDTLTSRHNLAAMYNSSGNPAKAEPIEESVLEASERILGKDHPITLDYVFRLADIYYHTGKKEQALKLARRSYPWRIKNLGPDHRQTRDNANLLRKLGDTP